MLIEKNCNIHGLNKVTLSEREITFYEMRKDFPHALEDWIKNDLKCSLCSREAKINELKDLSGIALRFKNCTFENSKESKEKKIIFEYAKNFKKIKSEGTSLVLCGTTGTGKTHLSSALTNYLIENYQARILYTKAFDVLREVKETYNRKSKYTFEDVHKKHVKVDLLIIDEVGVQFGTDTEKQILFEIINDRYENMKPTILITNLNLASLKEFAGDRVIDRMKENGGRIIVFSGESHRGKK
jgi:DNA replication protein DnaC